MITGLQEKQISSVKFLPSWLKQEIPNNTKIEELKNLIQKSRIHTVCQSAKCPNVGKCWGQGVATFMILGDTCTRACKFCAVKTGIPQPVNLEEPSVIAMAVKSLNLKYVVITSVARDDLDDLGCGQFVLTVNKIKEVNPGIKVEILIPDFLNRNDLLKKISGANPDVIGHNIEMVKRFFPEIRPQAKYNMSLSVLEKLKRLSSRYFVKSGFMVGLGETINEIKELMHDLLSAGCDILTIGQYIAPSKSLRHVEEARFVTPDEFDEYRQIGLKMGFKHVLSGPLVRSSFIEEKIYSEIVNN